MTKFDSGALSKHATLQKRRRCAITSLPSLTCLVISEDSSEMITLKKPTLMSAMKKGHGGLKYKSKRYSSLVGLDSGNVSDTSSASSTTSDQSSQSWPPLPESISVKGSNKRERPGDSFPTSALITRPPHTQGFRPQQFCT